MSVSTGEDPTFADSPGRPMSKKSVPCRPLEDLAVVYGQIKRRPFIYTVARIRKRTGATLLTLWAHQLVVEKADGL
jgi:hypothetical protein